MISGRSATAAVAIAKDGRLVLAKGYGLADIESPLVAQDCTRVRVREFPEK